eukprot:10338401-Lingulodinium_polyedra.AAC.1
MARERRAARPSSPSLAGGWRAPSIIRTGNWNATKRSPPEQNMCSICEIPRRGPGTRTAP